MITFLPREPSHGAGTCEESMSLSGSGEELFESLDCTPSNPGPGSSTKISAGMGNSWQSATVFKALSNPNRLIIVTAVADGERCVADLRNVDILESERRGTQIFYSLRKPCLLNIFCCLDDFHGDATD